ncbi:uncharacterized protein LOC135825099 [Sycon ciliatum]|uniref:uncharacterized protein LOC135825099 n=1 Tax=Sycon ciliatum TaxID=27933 RepID=UPI0031F6BF49
MNRYVGAGAYGTVIKAVTQGTNHPVSIKTSFWTRDPAGVPHEYDILKHIGRHPNIIQLIDLVVEITSYSDATHLVLNRCHTTLRNWLTTSVAPISANIRTEITRQLYSGVAFLHSRGVNHCDLHDANVLVSGYSGQVNIIDFGLSKFSDGHYDLVDRLRDVRNITMQAIVSMWLDGVNVYRVAVFSCRSAMLRRGMSFAHIGLAQHWLTFRSGEIYRNVHERSRRDYQTEMSSKPGLEDTITRMHAFNLTHRLQNRGVAVPESLHELLRYGMLVGPDDKTNAGYISERIDSIVLDDFRKKAQREICRITTDMYSTTV